MTTTMFLTNRAQSFLTWTEAMEFALFLVASDWSFAKPSITSHRPGRWLVWWMVIEEGA